MVRGFVDKRALANSVDRRLEAVWRCLAWMAGEPEAIDVLSHHLDDAFLRGGHVVQWLGAELSDWCPPGAELLHQLAVSDNAEPEKVTEARLIETMKVQPLVVWRCHLDENCPIPPKNHALLV
jgi:hypothetical protein